MLYPVGWLRLRNHLGRSPRLWSTHLWVNPFYAGYTFRCTSRQTVLLSQQVPQLWATETICSQNHISLNTNTRDLQSFEYFLQQTKIFKMAKIIPSIQWVNLVLYFDFQTQCIGMNKCNLHIIINGV